jgi:hypothetical protein
MESTSVSQSTIHYRPLIKFGEHSVNKNLVVEIFALAFYTPQIRACFKRLNINFRGFEKREEELITLLSE